MTGWHPELRALVESADPDNSTHLTIRVVEPGTRWHPGPVTLLGDAIHATSPTGGNGASTALREAALLRDHLTEAAHGRRPLLTALDTYEHQLVAQGPKPSATAWPSCPPSPAEPTWPGTRRVRRRNRTAAVRLASVRSPKPRRRRSLAASSARPGRSGTSPGRGPCSTSTGSGGSVAGPPGPPAPVTRSGATGRLGWGGRQPSGARVRVLMAARDRLAGRGRSRCDGPRRPLARRASVGCHRRGARRIRPRPRRGPSRHARRERPAPAARRRSGGRRRTPGRARRRWTDQCYDLRCVVPDRSRPKAK
ncbi:FAD-dependent oxidoreductase [Crossiella equi]|uniref:FAD-dependent oxidoreductase n=1 Tax=Crossiella equi TaxID=130796 RepID=UPI001FDAC118|nr:FAD-dependent monooxygenase [Crossiella equi]